MNDSLSVILPATSRRRRLRRLLPLAALLVATGAAASIAAHMAFSADTLGRDVAAQIHRTTGFSTNFEGATHLHLFPQPRIQIDNVTFTDAAGAVRIDAAVFSGYLRLLPLLAGRLELGHATLYQPNIFIALDRKPVLPESDIGKFAEAASIGAPQSAAPLGRIDIVDGHARIEINRLRTAEIGGINLDLDWPSADASAAVNGEISLHGVPIEIDGWLSQPVDLLRGRASAMTWRLQSDVLSLLTSGRVSATPRLQYVGQLAASAVSLRTVAQITGHAFPRHGAFANFGLRGDVDLEAANAALTNLHVSLDGNDYEGDLAVELGGALRLSGTLASDFVDVAPFLAQPAAPNAPPTLRMHQALDLSDLDFADLDLRVSASRLRLYDMELENTALSLVTKPGLVDLALAEANSNQGTLQGRVSIAAKNKTFEFHAIGTGKNIDVAPMALGVNGQHPFSGTLDASLTFDSTGTDLERLIQGLTGQAAILVTNGEIKGTDLATTFQQTETKTPGKLIVPVDGTTPFDKLSFALNLADGQAAIAQGQFDATSMQLNFAGNADIARRALDIAALGTVTQSASRRTETMPLSLHLKGSVDNLRLFQGEPGLRLPAARASDLPATTSASPPGPD